jgi:hypothetical protein
MNKTFSSMKLSVGNNVQDTSAEMQTLIGGYLNDRQTEIKQRLKNCLMQTSRLDYVVSVSTEDIVLPEDCGEIVSVLDKTNYIPLEEITNQQWVDKYHTAIDTSGTSRRYMVYDSPVRTQPAADGVLTVVSSSTADTTQTIYVRLIDSNGRETSESISLNGTTPVNGTLTASRILGISKSAATAGSVTVTRDTATLAVMSPDVVVSRIKLLRFASAPTTAFTCEIIYMQNALPMKNAYDYPSVDCCDALEAGATADAWRYKRQFQKASDYEQIYEKKVANIAYNYEAHPNKVTMMNPMTYSRNLC